ncbi:hypothetical protein F2Q69_00041454 [Brassica cretica]|uniref:Uncharacterized protein n=1 Tax=Brassica cretica TaxID=69181 RepID=A0A8S9NEE6_BRACR|nr:hypothetical protein F2Q69_00041454 [Brassica cretica]
MSLEPIFTTTAQAETTLSIKLSLLGPVHKPQRPIWSVGLRALGILPEKI